MESNRSESEEKVEAVLLPILQELGLRLYELEVQPGGRIMVQVDREGATWEPGTGITIEETAVVHRRLSYLLETEAVVPFEGALEVASPGVERDLQRPQHWLWAVGQQARAVLSREVEGQRVVEGVIEGLDTDGRVRLRLAGGAAWSLDLADVRRARTVFEFGGNGPRIARGAGGSGSKSATGSRAGASRRSSGGRKP